MIVHKVCYVYMTIPAKTTMTPPIKSVCRPAAADDRFEPAEPVNTTVSPVLAVATLGPPLLAVALPPLPPSHALHSVVVIKTILADRVHGQSVTVMLWPAYDAI